MRHRDLLFERLRRELKVAPDLPVRASNRSPKRESGKANQSAKIVFRRGQYPRPVMSVCAYVNLRPARKWGWTSYLRLLDELFCININLACKSV